MSCLPCVYMYYSYQQNPFIKYQLVIVPNYYAVITACGHFLMDFPLLTKFTKTDETKKKKEKNMRKLLEFGSSKTIEKLDSHGSRTLRQIIKCSAIYVNGTM